jgi:hypothetical protein
MTNWNTYPGFLCLSPIGTPVFNDLEIIGDSYTKNGVNYTFPTLRIPEAIITTAERENNLVVTEITGSPSPVVEYIGSKARIIDITMKITTPSGYPMAEVQNITTMLRSNQVLHITSWYINQILGVYDIVIVSENPPQKEGELNIQTITFKCMEVVPLALYGNTGNILGNPNAQQSDIAQRTG